MNSKAAPESDRILYTRMTEEDTEQVLSWRNSDIVRKAFIHQAIITREEHLNYIRTKINTGIIEQFVMHDCNSGKAFGCVYLRDIDHEVSVAEYGIFIGDKDFINRGYGTEACKATVSYAFEQLGLSSVILRARKTNIAAIESYKKSGFKKSPNEKTVIINGEPVDIIFMECSKNDNQKEGRGNRNG